WVLSRGRANLEEGQRLTVSGVIQDVTDEEATRRALADSETRLLRSQAIAGIGSYEWNLQTGVGEFSPNLLRLAGLPPEARPTLPELIEHVHPDDRAAVAEAAAKAAAGASHAEIEYRFVRPDGSVRWARDVGSTTRNSDGVPFWAGVIIDITAMREAADRIAESEVRTRLIHEFAGVGTWEFVVGDGMRWSPEIYRLYDRDPGDGPPDADGWSAMLHPDDVGTAMIPLKTLTPDQADFLAEFRVRRADGGWRWLQGQGRVVRDAAGAIVRVLGINIDISDRKAAEEALRQRERQLLSFVEHAPVGIAMFDREMRYLAASERFLADLGFGRDEVLGRCHYEVVPDIPERWREIHRRALAGETLRGEADRFERADGRIEWVDWETRPWLAPDGSIGGISLFAEYVTARVEAQRRLADSERLLRTIGDASLDLIFAKDRDGRMIYANTATAAVIGLPVHEAIGRREIDWATDRSEAEAIMANDRRIMAAGKPEVAEELFTSPDGTRRVWRSTKVPFRDETGIVVGLAGVSTDITELREREDELQRINAELQAIFETVPAAIWITRDPQALQIDGNRMSREVLRVPEPDANMSKSAADAPVPHFEVFDVSGRLIEPDDLPVQRAARGERVRDWRETIRFDDGEEISLIGNAEPLYGEDGTPRGAVAAFVDISALERAERALVEINASLEARIAAATAERETALAQLHEMQKLETLGQLTGGVAHDFNNLLTPIIGSLDLLRRRHGEDAREARLIDGALAAADRARVLVSRLLAFGRRQMLQPRAVDIAALVGDATEIITRTIGPQVPVRVEVPAGLPMARADPNQLELALLNLAVNARDAMPGG
ncbi:PAS domain S-box protein, partial [Bradyrhizobium sp.]|uniref:PAS domain S-box protein n=1 Tax=Bradyrhizobium sp. TaxID=376 RepID=UPI0025C5F264